MSQENVEVVSRWARQVVQNVSVHQNDRRSYAAKLQRGEFDQGAGVALDLLHPEVTCTSPLGEVYEGKLNYAHYAGELLETLGDYALSLREVTDLGGDQMLADYGVEMRGCGQWDRRALSHLRRVHPARWVDLSAGRMPHQARGPQSRGAGGVGGAAGERGAAVPIG